MAEEGRGVWIRDVDGNVFLDFTAGIAVCSTGHCHPKVIEAVKDQAERLLHMSGADFYYPPQIALAEKLSSLMPGEGDKRFFRQFRNRSGGRRVQAGPMAYQT